MSKNKKGKNQKDKPIFTDKEKVHNIKILNSLMDSLEEDKFWCPHEADGYYDEYYGDNPGKVSDNCPCPYDWTALTAKRGNLQEGCFHRCVMRNKPKKVLENKDVINKATKTIIDIIENNPEWCIAKKRDKTLITNDESLLFSKKHKKNIIINESSGNTDNKPNNKMDDKVIGKILAKEPNSELKRLEIDMFVRGSADYKKKPYVSESVVMLSYKDKRKVIYIKKEGLTSSQVMIEGIKAGIDALKNPTIVNIYTHENPGASAFNGKGYNGANKEYIASLVDKVDEGNHKLNFTVSHYMQEHLRKTMISMRNK